jgi:calcineurin-like phosphoesterase family protein
MMADVWFTSDFHLGHFNIIRYCNRPFVDTQEMNAVILERLNAAVKPNDVLYFLGDFCMGGPKAVASFREQIACKTVHFIDGNHDKTARKDDCNSNEFTDQRAHFRGRCRLRQQLQ